MPSAAHLTGNSYLFFLVYTVIISGSPLDHHLLEGRDLVRFPSLFVDECLFTRGTTQVLFDEAMQTVHGARYRYHHVSVSRRTRGSPGGLNGKGFCKGRKVSDHSASGTRLAPVAPAFLLCFPSSSSWPGVREVGETHYLRSSIVYSSLSVKYLPLPCQQNRSSPGNLMPSIFC